MYVPAGGGPMPFYFSGTNSRASGSGQIGEGIAYASLKLNGELVNDYSHVPGEPWVFGLGLSVYFDSSHFANGTTVDVELLIRGASGAEHTKHGSAIVKNFASLFGRYDLDIYPLTYETDHYIFGDDSWIGLPTAADALSGMGYAIQHRVTTLGWNQADLLTGLADCTVLYIHTHGNTTWYWTDQNDRHYDYPAKPLTASENAHANDSTGDPLGFKLKPTRLAAMGSGLPPFNSTGMPPITVAFMDACDTGTDNSFADAYLPPFTNAYSNPYIEDQAEIGYNTHAMLSETLAVGEAFWGCLADGYTACEARARAFDAYDASNKPPSETDLYHLWGDYYTRLKGVYTWGLFPSPQHDWFQ